MKAVYFYKKTYRTPRDLSGVPGYIKEDNWSVDFSRPLDHIETNNLGLSFIVAYTGDEEE